MFARCRSFFGVRWRSRSGGVCSGLRCGERADKFGTWRRRRSGNGLRFGSLGAETGCVERSQDLGDEEIEIGWISRVGTRSPSCTRLGSTRYLSVRMMLTTEVGKRLQSGSKQWRDQKRAKRSNQISEPGRLALATLVRDAGVGTRGMRGRHDQRGARE
eukprot:4751892-Pleurochrysis_carterae.AAC.1